MGFFGPSAAELERDRANRALAEEKKKCEATAAQAKAAIAAKDAEYARMKMSHANELIREKNSSEEDKQSLKQKHEQEILELQNATKRVTDAMRREAEKSDQKMRDLQAELKQLDEFRKLDKINSDNEKQRLKEKMEDEVRHSTEILKLKESFQKDLQLSEKAKYEQLNKDRELQTQQQINQMAQIREMHKNELQSSQAQHNEVIKLMSQQLQINREQNEKLIQSLGAHMQSFQNSRDDFFEYIGKKPKFDIKVTDDMAGFIQKAKADLNLDTENCYNFAFVGHVKTGKSSLINAVRGLKNNDPAAAKVGETETTSEIEPFSFTDPQFKHVKIYDIPGSGTISHNASSYYHDKSLCAFDCLIMCTQDVLGQEEIEFAIQSLKFNQPICFVRSKFDIVLDNAKKEGEIDVIDQVAVEKYITKVSEAFIEEIKRVQKPELCRVPCFFLSAYSLRDLIQGNIPEAVYHEQYFLDYIKAKSKFSRNILS